MKKKKKPETWWALAIEGKNGKWEACHWAAKTRPLLRESTPTTAWPENNKCYRYVKLLVEITK